VPFGNAVIEANDAKLAHEICEEIFTTSSPHVLYDLIGVDIIGHGSGSHHQLRKL
jgi:NAD+ synthase (glutamine-hydrolysing)